MALAGHRILIVEDDPFVGCDMRSMFEEAGGCVVGPVADLAEALKVARDNDIELAVLDFEIVGGSSHEVAEALAARGTPFMFHTGCPEQVRKLWPKHAVFNKPADPVRIVSAASAML